MIRDIFFTRQSRENISALAALFLTEGVLYRHFEYFSWRLPPDLVEMEWNHIKYIRTLNLNNKYKPRVSINEFG